MNGATRFTSGWVFFAILGVTTCSLLVSPLQPSAQNNCPTPSTGQDAVYNTTCNNGPVVGSSAFIDASQFGGSNTNICKVLNGILSSTTYPGGWPRLWGSFYTRGCPVQAPLGRGFSMGNRRTMKESGDGRNVPQIS
jgi:hypothetical protein